MAYIANWLNEHLQAKQADLIVEDTLTDLRRRSGLLEEYVPLKTYDGRKFLSYVVKEINAVASIISYGAEPPVAAQGNFQKITAEMLKAGLTYRFDEETQWDMKEAMELASAKGINVQDMMLPDGTVLGGSNNDLASYLFGTVERMVRAQVDLLDALTWKALETGAVSWTDPRTNTTVTLDYKEAGAPYTHFPATLTAGARWTEYSTANGIQNLYDAVDTFIDTNGYPPDLIVMSRKLRNHLMQQTSTKNAASSLTVTQVGTVSPDMLKALLEARGIPPIVTFDERYEVENSSKVISNARFLSDNRFVFLNKNMGQRAMGTTIESDGQTGVYTAVREIQKFPPVDAIQGVATILPVFAKPKLFFSQRVLNDS